MRLYLFVLFLLITLESIIGCFNPKDRNQVSLMEDKNHELILPLDSETPDYTIPDGCSYAKINNENILVFYNRLKSKLLFFNLKNHQLIHSIQYEKNELYPINHIMGIEVINRDSIFLLPSYTKRLYLSN